MERKLKMKLASALAAVSYDVIKSNKADLLYELIDAVETLERGESYVLFARSSGADSMKRFHDCLVEDGVSEPSIADCVQYASKTLGLDVILLFENNPHYGFDVTLLNVKMDKYDFWRLKDDLVCRGIFVIKSECGE